jgi:hypothetical protein
MFFFALQHTWFWFYSQHQRAARMTCFSLPCSALGFGFTHNINEQPE